MIRGIPFDLIDFDQAIQTVHHWKISGQRKYGCFVNPHSVQLGQSDPEMKWAIHNSDLSLPDGVGVILAAKILRYPNCSRVAGPSFMLNLCDWGRQHQYRHFFYGGAIGVPERLAERLCEKFPGLIVAGTYSPPFRSLAPQEEQESIDRINQSKPDVLWVGLGAPKQEKWMHAHCGKIEVPIMLGVGAAFDFHSGNVNWAPPLVRKAGLEWAYRLTIEPKRMWKRNLNNARFLGGVVLDSLSGSGS